MKSFVNFVKKHISFLIMSFILLNMIVFNIVFAILKTNQDIAEKWTRYLAGPYLESMGKFNAIFSFSITEVSIIVTVISIVVFLAWGFSLLGNKKIWPFIHRVLMSVLIFTGVITMYNATVGMAYNRDKLPLETYHGEIKKEEFVQIATYFVEDCNNCADQLSFDENGEIKMPYSQAHLVEIIRSEYSKINDDYYNEYTPYAKPMISSTIYMAFGIVGMYFGVLGEANYSTYSTNAELPYYIAHEMAHGKGVMREDDAQLLATYVCLNSSDPLLRYSCYYNTIGRILDITKYTENSNDYNDVKGLISDKVWKNYDYIYYHWKGKTFMSDLGDKINDWYLKTFGQKEGTTSYNDTPTEVDPGGKVINLSNYQSLYFKIYYDNKA